MSVTLRWQMGPFLEELPWLALDTSIRLMRRLVPEAECHVTHQTSGIVGQPLEGVQYHPQEASRYPWGRHEPARFNEDSHEVWLDNDHIMWALPSAWKYWIERDDSVLIWRTDWDYYGRYSAYITQDASAGFFGLPPERRLFLTVYDMEGNNQDEMGAVVKSLFSFPKREYIYEDNEVTVYNPSHPVLDKCKIGTHGVHLMGMNRGFNPDAEAVLDDIRIKHGL